jgi:hypothetical protein
MTDYSRTPDEVPADELQNWPKGCAKSSHQFMDLKTSPIVERPYFHNEEIFYLYKLRWNELVFEDGMESVEAQKQAKIELIPIIYPNVDLTNFRKNNPLMSDKCCRLIFDVSLDAIASMHVVHGEGLKIFGCSIKGDVDLGIPDDPLWGFDLTKPKEGFPCVNLGVDGCSYHPDGKPDRCKKFPVLEQHVILAPTCSYQFDEEGNRTGSCNRCIG